MSGEEDIRADEYRQPDIGNNTNFLNIFFKDFFIYLFREGGVGRDTGRGRSRLHAGSPMQDSITDPQDHTLGPRQAPIC